MNVVLIFSVLILVTIAIWQVTKIFELSQEKKVSTQVADDNDNDCDSDCDGGCGCDCDCDCDNDDIDDLQ